MIKPKLCIVVDDSILNHHHGVRRYILSISECLNDVYEVEFFHWHSSELGKCVYNKLIFDQRYAVNNGFNESVKLDNIDKNSLIDFFTNEINEKNNNSYFPFTLLYYGSKLPRTDVCIVGSPWIMYQINEGLNAQKTYCIGYDAIPIMYAMNTSSDDGLYRFAREHYLGYERAINEYNGVLAISEASKIQMSYLNLDNDSIFVVPPFIPYGFNNVENSKRYDNSIILAAPFDERKGFKRIPSLLNKTNVERVIIFGGVRCRQEDILDFFEQLECCEVEWWPKVTTEDQIRLYSSSSLLLFPSYSEGLGLPVIEALACGTNVLVSDIEPLNSLVERSSVLLSKDEEVKAQINKQLSSFRCAENKNFSQAHWGKNEFTNKMLKLFER
ncbi:glycosyltransferase [Vibrio mediterranei]|uniref:glycosyltransferase n=1 Tax=Vibrio mediterranei TaxID=689 RepID=UPI0018575138|nr:glycosyltransferase [Vibrio mediterranei]NUW73830.1 glycosyltransferase [Vibrio mediterranei]